MTNLPRAEYPRPDFERESFTCLNGQWEFAYDDNDLGLSEKWYLGQEDRFNKRITVPYTYLCELSGINDQDFHDIVWYRRKVLFKKNLKDGRFLLHFGAIDHTADIWIDAEHVCHHEGGNTPVTIDVTNFVSGEEEHFVTVRAFDDSSDFQMTRGKQFWERKSQGIFYTRTVGIWQSVWFEEVPRVYLDSIRITPDLDERMIEIEMEVSGAKESFASVNISLRGQELLSDEVRIKNGRGRVKYWLDSAITLDWHHQESWTWSPENPVLFDADISVRGTEEGAVPDKVKTYFAFRKINVVNGRILLNNRPYYMKMLLDQGYFRKGLLTAPSDEDLKRDIESAKKMGFNGVRKHQKVEDPRFLYWADKLGLLVWGEGPSSYEYSHLAVERHTAEWLEILKRDYSHPCIIAWVPLNESWGVHEILNREDEQAHSLALYYLIKSIDKTRLVISNDGWTHTKSDIVSIHDYSGDRDELSKRYE
ncbi:MAG: glycoside hydrolase family 2, partial [Butyrivibrio sp.]|nr:glycoside hydrolase family 2 [Butyrivibrio sp.]